MRTPFIVPSRTNFGLWVLIAYLVAEAGFNLALVDFTTSRNTEISVFSGLERFGRALSSIGLALFLDRLLATKFVFGRRLALGAAIAAGFYLAQTVFFEQLIQGLPPEKKLAVYTVGVYNNLSLNAQVPQVLTGSSNASLLNERYDTVAQAMMGPIALANGPLYRAMREHVRAFFSTSSHRADFSFVDALYDELHRNHVSMESLWGVYSIESRKYENYRGIFGKQKYYDAFVEKVGIPPGLSKPAFIQHFGAAEDKLASANDTVLVPGNANANVEPLRLGDIPEGLNKKEWGEVIKAGYQRLVDSYALTASNVEHLPHSRDIVASVVITPIAIGLSLLVFLLNFSRLVARGNTLVGAGLFVGVMVLGSLWSHNPYNLPALTNRLLTLETQFVTALAPYKALLHTAFINDEDPNIYELVRIEPPDHQGLGEHLSKEIESLQAKLQAFEGGSGLANVEYTVNHQKIEERSYYGELNKSSPFSK